jgi:hypothetical protein
MKRIIQATIQTFLMFAFVVSILGICFGVVYLYNNYSSIMLKCLPWVSGIGVFIFAWWLNYKNTEEPYNDGTP